MNKTDFYIDKVREPKNGLNCIRILDKVSSSVHLILGPTGIIWRNGRMLDKIITEEDINKLEKLRTSLEILYKKHYELDISNN